MFGHKRELPPEDYDSIRTSFLRIDIRTMRSAGFGRRNRRPFRYFFDTQVFTPQAEAYEALISSFQGMKNAEGVYANEESSPPDKDFMAEETELHLGENRSGYELYLLSYGLAVNERNFRSVRLYLPKGFGARMVYRVKQAHVRVPLSFNEAPSERQLALFSDLVKTSQPFAR